MRDAPIRGGALAHAKGRSKKAFDELVAEYRQQGISDAEIVRAMVASPKRLLAGSKQKNGTQNQESRRFIRFAASLLTKILKFQRVENASVFSLSPIGDFDSTTRERSCARRGKPPLRFPKGDG